MTRREPGDPCWEISSHSSLLGDANDSRLCKPMFVMVCDLGTIYAAPQQYRWPVLTAAGM